MFIGEYEHSIDEKGRLAVPNKFRKALQTGMVITRGLDHCLFVYTKEAWAALAQRLSTLPLSQKNTRAFARLFLAGAMDVAVDKQGRVMVPDYLRTYAGLTKKAVITGVYDRLEIWDAAAWQAYKAHTEKDSDQIAETLGGVGL